MALEISLERELPCSLESERAVLGAVLLDGREVFPASEILNDSDFLLEAHREVFRAMLALSAESCPIDLVTVREELRRRNKEEAAGGIAYLASLTDGLPRGVNLAHYARTVREKATARQLIQLSNDVMTRCYQGEERPAAVLERAESEIFRIAAREIRGGFQSAKDLAPIAFKEIEEASKHDGPVTGLDTGFTDLNRMTGGLHRQNLIVVAARPGLGKTSLCLNIAAHVALRRGKSVGIFSLEMSKPEIMKRMISAVAEVDSHRIQSGYLSREDWVRVSKATAEFSEAPVFIDDSANLTMLQVRAKAQRLALEHGLGLVVVDYLQLVSGSGRRHENRTQEVTEISRGLKNLAKELDVPVAAAAQLNREVERRAGSRRPLLSDLRESGAIEADADLVLFISREDADGGDGAAEVTVAKHRNGATGAFGLAFDRRCTRFRDLRTGGGPDGDR